MSQTEEPVVSNIEQNTQQDQLLTNQDQEPLPEQMSTETNQVYNDPSDVTTTLNGVRPFVGAIVQYKQTLDAAVSRAVNMLRMHPEYMYMNVKLPFFHRIVVPCKKNNEVVNKTYMLHDVHYAPRCKTQRHPNETDLEYYVRSFKTRYWKIWVDVNIDPTKNPGGDGTGTNNTACSVFRTLQLDLVQYGMFLVDMSDFDNAYHGLMRYNINVRVYRQKPPYPAKCWHQYGLIPGLGAIPRVNNDVNIVNDDDINWPPLEQNSNA